MSSSSSSQHHNYVVEHLATFSTNVPHQQQTTPKAALQRLFAMEKTSGIWTQRMTIKIEGNHMLILDGESSDVVERFPVTLIQEPTAFNHHNHIYNNILIFTVQHPDESQGELHIFQCVSNSAQQIVDELNNWMRRFRNSHIGGQADVVTPAHNLSVKQAVNAFNAIAAQREKTSVSPVGGSPHRRSPVGPHSRDHDSRSVATTSSIDSSQHNGAHHRSGSHEQSLSNERYVSILNHCFDDIERFIIRLQHAAAALRELQLRNYKRQGKGPAHGGDGLLAIRARGPTEEEFFQILSKFKLAFNLLAKLKGCIHDPNAPELVHFLFTPLAIIIEAARSNGPSPVDPSVVGVPYLNSDAIELLSNCCTSKEFDLWQSLGPNWTQPIRQNHVMQQQQPSRALPGSYQPVFTDGWAPTITDPELMGLNSSSDQSEQEEDSIPIHVQHRESVPSSRRETARSEYSRQHYADSDADDHMERGRLSPQRAPPVSGRAALAPPSPIDSIERDSPIAIQINDLEQSEWLADLQARNAKIVRVLFPRTANNEKELTVVRGEFLEILDDSRKWWKARNWRGQIAHVPHTIVSEIACTPNAGRDSEPQLTRGSPNEDWIRKERQAVTPKTDIKFRISSYEGTPSKAGTVPSRGLNDQLNQGSISKGDGSLPPQYGFHNELTETLKRREAKRLQAMAASEAGSAF